MLPLLLVYICFSWRGCLGYKYPYACKVYPLWQISKSAFSLINLPAINFPAWLKLPKISWRFDNLCENWQNQSLDSQIGQLNPDLWWPLWGHRDRPELLPQGKESFFLDKDTGTAVTEVGFWKATWTSLIMPNTQDLDQLSSRKDDSTASLIMISGLTFHCLEQSARAVAWDCFPPAGRSSIPVSALESYHAGGQWTEPHDIIWLHSQVCLMYKNLVSEHIPSDGSMAQQSKAIRRENTWYEHFIRS